MHEKLRTEIQSIHRHGMTEQSAQRITHILEEEGITSSARFTDLLLELVEHERRQPTAVELGGETDPLGIDQNRNGNLKLVHRPPDVPFYFQGTMMDPKDINHFDGNPLHFAIDGDGEDAKLIACEYYREIVHFARRRNLLTMIRNEVSSQLGVADTYQGYTYRSWLDIAITPKGHGFIHCPHDAPRPSSEAQFFQHADFDGDWLWLAPGFEWPDLTNVGRGGVFCVGCDWNDEISSLKTGDGWVVVCEHVHLQGSTLSFFGAIPTPIREPINPACGRTIVVWTSGRQVIANLGTIGWNDRISSIVHLVV